MIKIAFIDHYDSFSFNLIDWLREVDSTIEIDYICCEDRAKLDCITENPVPTVISPGPGSPHDYPMSMACFKSIFGRAPVFGICLGHQIMAASLGAKIIPALDPIHGVARKIMVKPGLGIFYGCAPRFHAATYNSLVVSSESLASNCNIIGWCEREQVQALEYVPNSGFSSFSVQFHPESFLSEGQDLLKRNWTRLVRSFFLGFTRKDLG